MKLRAFSVRVLCCGSLLATAAVAQEEEEKKLGWTDKAELSLVLTSGNSQTGTFGFRNDLSHDWDNARLLIEVAGLRTETGVITRTPVGSSLDDFEVQKSVVKDVTAENYLARGKYDRNLTDRFFLYGTGGWGRSEFAGIRNRTFGAGGVGNIWYDVDSTRWRTDYGLSVTREEGTVAEVETFAGMRLSSDFMRKLTGNTTLTNVTIADENLNETADFRLDSLTALAVAINARLALKVSLQFLFDNEPSFIEAPLEFPPGNVLDILVPVPADELDTFFSVALVVNF